MDNKAFYKKAQMCKSVNAFAALAQCNWETRKNGRPWQSDLFLAANNAAGLKAWNGWPGETFRKVSWEELPGGQEVNKSSDFCKYPTVDAFLENYDKKIATCYPDCVRRRDNFWGYFAGLFSGKYGAWATDSAYFTRLVSVAVEIAPEIFGNLWQSKLVDSFNYAVKKGYLSEEQAGAVLGALKQVIAPELLPDYKQASLFHAPVVVLDFGHGGNDSGATAGGVCEKNLVLEYGKSIGRILSKRNVSLVYTRIGDEFIPLSRRAEIAEKNVPRPAAFVSIHANSATSTSAKGFEAYTYFGQDAGDVLAQLITTRVKKAIPNIVVRAGVAGGCSGKEANYAVLRETPNVPSCLLELGFLSNPEERGNLLRPAYQEAMTQAIADGILQFVGV